MKNHPHPRLAFDPDALVFLVSLVSLGMAIGSALLG